MVPIEEGRNSRVSQSPRAIFFEKSRITNVLLSVALGDKMQVWQINAEQVVSCYG